MQGIRTKPPQTGRDALTPDYRQFMIRELFIWLVGVPVPVAAIIGLFVL
ncbi:hypothetical protein [Pararhizobium arenae]|jgi:hypothetical protein|nr:hypothetical protein [Pararhizobium arenae]